MSKQVYSHVMLGQAAETHIAALLSARRVHLSGYDLVWRGIRLEVKAARLNARGNFQVMLRKHDRHGHADVSKSDILIVLCMDNEHIVKCLVMDVIKDVPDTKTLTIGRYTSKYDAYQVKPSNLKAYLSKFV